MLKELSVYKYNDNESVLHLSACLSMSVTMYLLYEASAEKRQEKILPSLRGNLSKVADFALCVLVRVITTIKSRRMRWAGHVERMGETRNAYRILVGTPEGKRPLGRPRRRRVLER
jgi:hypothetical protein